MRTLGDPGPLPRRASDQPGRPIPDITEIEWTVECRWWARGAVTPALGTWFTALGDVVTEPDRVDRYLLGYLRPDQNVKLRHGTIPEVKLRTARTLRTDLAPGAAGWVERWRKWSVARRRRARRPGDAGPMTLDVHKQRRLVDVAGCRVELTQAIIRGQPWHSVALEAADEPAGTAVLDDVVLRLVETGLARHLPLTADTSHGYAAQILASPTPDGASALDEPEGRDDSG